MFFFFYILKVVSLCFAPLTCRDRNCARRSGESRCLWGHWRRRRCRRCWWRSSFPVSFIHRHYIIRTRIKIAWSTLDKFIRCHEMGHIGRRGILCRVKVAGDWSCACSILVFTIIRIDAWTLGGSGRHRIPCGYFRWGDINVFWPCHQRFNGLFVLKQVLH